MGTDPAARPRALAFGEVAALYDEARPGYPDELVTDVVGLLRGRDVAEIGAGTGKATTAFARHGLRLTCVEPDPAMAAVLRERCAGLRDVSVLVRTFEDWEPSARFDGLISAQAWHWTAPETRWHKAAEVLRPDGLLALFWNVPLWSTTEPVHRLVNEVYAAHGIVDDTPFGTTDLRPDGWPANEMRAAEEFGHLGMRSYRWSRRYTATSFARYLHTTSRHLLLAPEQRRALFADIVAVIDRHSAGELTVDGRTDLHLARRR